MKLCIPTLNAEGLDSTLSQHFGSAPYYTLLNVESGTTEMVENSGHGHGHGGGHHQADPSCRPLLPLIGHGIDAVVCLGLGRRAYARFLETELDVFSTHGQTVDDVLVEARHGQLSPLDTKGICGGGRHQGDSRDRCHPRGH